MKWWHFVKKKHPNKPLSDVVMEAPGKTPPTRQQIRYTLRKQEYLRHGIGLGTRPLFTSTRRIIRAVARAIANRQYREKNWKVHHVPSVES